MQVNLVWFLYDKTLRFFTVSLLVSVGSFDGDIKFIPSGGYSYDVKLPRNLFEES